MHLGGEGGRGGGWGRGCILKIVITKGGTISICNFLWGGGVKFCLVWGGGWGRGCILKIVITKGGTISICNFFVVGGGGKFCNTTLF